MRKPQWTTASIFIVLLIILYAATQNQIFGNKKTSTPADHVHTEGDGHDHGHAPEATASITFDTILVHAKEKLSSEQLTRLNFLENSISRGDVKEQKLHLFHQLARFWHDSASVFQPVAYFEPYAFYTAEAARLENSEKSLTFAAHLFLNSLKAEEHPGLKGWKALQAKDLFERSLKINPANDSSEVGLGAVYLFGGVGESPMEGILRIRKVVEKDPENVYAQMTLGYASVVSNQLDKAIERFQKVLQIQPANLEANLLLADVYERKGDKAAAITWYKKTLPLLTDIPGLKKEVESRIALLSK